MYQNQLINQVRLVDWYMLNMYVTSIGWLIFATHVCATILDDWLINATLMYAINLVDWLIFYTCVCATYLVDWLIFVTLVCNTNGWLIVMCYTCLCNKFGWLIVICYTCVWTRLIDWYLLHLWVQQSTFAFLSLPGQSQVPVY